MTHVKFVCPDCSFNQLEEVQDSCVVSVQLYDISVDVEEDGGWTCNCEYGEEEVCEAFTDRYQCSNCGFVLTKGSKTPIKDLQDLGEWLISHEAPETEPKYGIFPFYVADGSISDLTFSTTDPEELVAEKHFRTIGERNAFAEGLLEADENKVCGYEKQKVIDKINQMRS